MTNPSPEEVQPFSFTLFLLRFSSIGDVLIACRTVLALKKMGIPVVLVSSYECKEVIDRCTWPVDVFYFQAKESYLEYQEEVFMQLTLHKQEQLVVYDVQNTGRSRSNYGFLEKTFKRLAPGISVQWLCTNKRGWERFLHIFKTWWKGLFLRQKVLVEKTVGCTPAQALANRLNHAHYTQMFTLAQICPYVKDRDIYRYLRTLEKGEQLEVYLKTPRVRPIKTPFICLFIGASHSLKRWPISHFLNLAIRIISKTNYHIVLCGGQQEEELATYFAHLPNDRFSSWVGVVQLGVTMDALLTAAYIVTSDSFPAHVADAAHIPCSVIFGPTDTSFGFAPFSDKVTIHEQHLACRPCSRHGQGSCRFGNQACLKGITPDEVFERILFWTSKSSLPAALSRG